MDSPEQRREEGEDARVPAVCRPHARCRYLLHLLPHHLRLRDAYFFLLSPAPTKTCRAGGLLRAFKPLLLPVEQTAPA